MHPILPYLDRICTVSKPEKGFPLHPYNEFIVPKGMPILFPIAAIQRDPKVKYK